MLARDRSILLAAALLIAPAAGAQTATAPSETKAVDSSANSTPAVSAAPATTATSSLNDEQKQDSFFDPRKTAWTVQVEPFMWYASPSGDLRLPARSGTGGANGGGFPNSGNKVDIADLNLDTPRFSPAGEIHFSADRFRFTFSGAAYSLDRDETPADESFRIGSVEVAPGDPLDINFDFSTYEVSLGYCVWARDFMSHTDGSRRENATPLVLRTYVLGGVRMYDTDISVTNIASSDSANADHFFIEPMLGARAEIEIHEVFSIDLQLSGGYYSDSDQSSTSIDVAVGFTYRPHPNVGIQIGWRQIAYDLTDGDGLDEFEYSGRMAGLFTGLTLRF